MKPHYKLIKAMPTEEFRDLVWRREIRSTGWTRSYRRPGNTIPVLLKGDGRWDVAGLVLFGNGDTIFLCRL